MTAPGAPDIPCDIYHNVVTHYGHKQDGAPDIPALIAVEKLLREIRSVDADKPCGVHSEPTPSCYFCVWDALTTLSASHEALNNELRDIISECGHERRYIEKSQWPECMQCRAEAAEAQVTALTAARDKTEPGWQHIFYRTSDDGLEVMVAYRESNECDMPGWTWMCAQRAMSADVVLALPSAMLEAFQSAWLDRRPRPEPGK
jgi:hypothetical protein